MWISNLLFINAVAPDKTPGTAKEKKALSLYYFQYFILKIAVKKDEVRGRAELLKNPQKNKPCHKGYNYWLFRWNYDIVSCTCVKEVDYLDDSVFHLTVASRRVGL